MGGLDGLVTLMVAGGLGGLALGVALEWLVNATPVRGWTVLRSELVAASVLVGMALASLKALVLLVS